MVRGKQERELKMIKKEGYKWCVYDSTGKQKLGCHDTKEDALKQLRAVEISKKQRAENSVGAFAKLNGKTWELMQAPEEMFMCECISCGYTVQSNEHCALLKCPKCGSTMRRADRPGIGRTNLARLSKGKWVPLPSEKLAKKQPTTVQTYIFDKKKFDKTKAEKWLKGKGKKTPSVDETSDFYRYRQIDPNKFIPNSFRTINITEGIKAVIGHLRK